MENFGLQATFWKVIKILTEISLAHQHKHMHYTVCGPSGSANLGADLKKKKS